MKSIKQQYIDLREGRMTQHNFMRSLRMSMPQYVTNVTSFKDSVRILKNKGILNENIDELYAAAPDPIEVALKSYLAKGYTYTESIRAVAAEEGIDEETLASQYPQDRVDIEGHEPEENDDEIAAMIAKAEDELSPEMYKNYDFPGGLSEKAHDGLKIEWDWDNADVDYDTDEDGNEGAFGTVFGKDKKGNAYSARFDAPVSGGDADFDSADVSSIKKTEDASELYEAHLKVKGKLVKTYTQNGDKSYNVVYDDGSKDTIFVSHDDWDKINDLRKSATNMNEAKEIKGSSGKEQYSKFSEAQKDNLQELTTGINIEHECFPEKSYEEIEKIVLKNIKKIPLYYTNYKLTGIRGYEPQTMDASKPETHQMKLVKGEDSYVDKARVMKPVKGFEKAKASANKASKEVNKIVKGVEELTHFAQTVRGLQKFATTGGKMKVIRLKEAKLNLNPDEQPNKTVQQASQFIDSNPVLRQISNDITLQNDGENAVLKYDYWKALPDEAYNKLELQFNVEDDFEAGDEEANKIAYILMPKINAYKQFGNTAGFGNTLQSKLEALVREVMNEMYDGGSEDLAAMARSSNTLRHKPETQAIAKKAAESANNKEEAASLAVKLAKAKGITDSEQITHIVDLATSKFMNEMFDGRDDMNAQNEY